MLFRSQQNQDEPAMNKSSLNLQLDTSTTSVIETFKPSDAFRPSDSSAAEFIPQFDNSDCSPQNFSQLSSPTYFNGFTPKSPNGFCKFSIKY